MKENRSHKKKSSRRTKSSREELLLEFEALPRSAIVDENLAAAARNKQVSSLQRERHIGIGPKYVRDGRSVGYRKGDLLDYIERSVVTPSEASTSEATP